MKKQFKFLLALGAVLMAFFAVGAAQPAADVVDTVAQAGGVYTEFQQQVSGGGATVAFAAVAKRELVERELIKHFRHLGTWLEAIPSKNQWVNNDVIRLNEVGADPNVLINNNTYPINVSSRTDSSTAISLYKYDTENTRVTDDELYGLPYDKVGSVQQQHRLTLEEHTRMHALHSVAPQENTADTPIIKTTGEADGTRKRLVYADLVRLKKQLDTKKVPKAGRMLVLSPEHIADLLIEDKALQVQYQNHTAGMLSKNYAGFELYEDIYAPEYNPTTLQKIAYGEVEAGSVAASIVVHKGTAVKARGSVKLYRAKAEDDPQNRETVMGLRLWFLAIPTRALGQGAIISDATA